MKMQTLAATLLAVASHDAFAQESAPTDKTTVGVSLNASILLGFGLSVGTGLGDKFNVRGVFNGFSISREVDDDKGTYDAKVKLQSLGVLGDWHPWAGAFRITAGMLSDGNQITAVGKAKNGADYEVGDCIYQSSSTPGQELHLDGKIDFRSLAPYLGLGWGGNMNSAPGFYGTFDLGVMFAGAPRVGLTAGGQAHAKTGQAPSCGDNADHPVASYAPFQAELDKARAEIDDNANKVKLWPSIQFGFGWRF